MALTRIQKKENDNAYYEVQQELDQLLAIKIGPFVSTLKQENENAYDYCFHGVTRRIYLIKRCLKNFQKIAPPEISVCLSNSKRQDLNLFLHSFLLNISGGIDNLAWVWFYKRKIDQKEDPEKFRTKIDLFGGKFKKYLDKKVIDKCNEFRKWHEHLKSFRDPTAHRVPPYIIPYTVDPKDSQKHYSLEQQLSLTTENKKKKMIQKKLDMLRDYEPKYSHSFISGSNIVYFHPQNIADTRTFCVLTGLVIECLQN